MNTVQGLFGLVLCVAVAGCAGSHSDVKPEDWRARLRAAMDEDVPSREHRDELSRLLVDAVEGGALDRLTRPDVQAAFGPGLACESYPLCHEQGFASSDWYYFIGHTEDAKIKQLPVLIVGFDPHERVSRVYTLRTH